MKILLLLWRCNLHLNESSGGTKLNPIENRKCQHYFHLVCQFVHQTEPPVMKFSTQFYDLQIMKNKILFKFCRSYKNSCMTLSWALTDWGVSNYVSMLDGLICEANYCITMQCKCSLKVKASICHWAYCVRLFQT